MIFDILTLFPGMFSGPFDESIISRARGKGILDINIINIRDFTYDKHHITDDYPFGGGAGMVMKVEPIYRAWEDIQKKREMSFPTILLSPQGRRLDQDLVKKLSKEKGLILICGHYEGVDERVRKKIITDEISIGDYVLTGGELAAMVLVDSVARMISGVLGDEKSKVEDSFYDGLLEYPQYTRPREFKGMGIPEVLLNGNHARINEWRKKESLKKTLLYRPDLLDKRKISKEEELLLEEIKKEFEDDQNE
jgi:tRNA (guanine37-N1)-methyltransferase